MRGLDPSSEGSIPHSRSAAQALSPAAPLLLRRLLEPANLLSLVRIPLGAVALVLYEDAGWLLALAAIAGITDMLDGAVARWTHPELARPVGDAGSSVEEPIGAWLDPLCDKAFVLAWLGAIALRGAPLHLLVLVAVRDVGIALLGTLQLTVPALRARRRRYTARPSGKLTTVLQFAALAAILLQAPDPTPLVLAAASALVGLGALGEYVHRALAAPAPPR